MEKTENLENPRPMTRAEWVKQARIECEKHLEYTPRKAEMEEHVNYMSPGEPKYQAMHGRVVQGSSIVAEVPKQMEYEEGVTKRQAVQEEGSSNDLHIRLLRLRIMASSMILLMVMVIDFFHIKTETITSEAIKECITGNQSVNQLEESVSTFIEDKIIPVFQGDASSNTENDSVAPISEQQSEDNNTDANENTNNNTTSEEEQVGILDKRDGVTESAEKADVMQESVQSEATTTPEGN